jgi:hypothetical protein
MLKQPLAEILADIRDNFDRSKPVQSIPYNKIADEVGYLRELKTVIENREKKLTDSLKERLSLDAITEDFKIQGSIFGGLLVVPVTQMRLNNDLVKAEQGETWFKSHCKEIKFIQIRVIK